MEKGDDPETRRESATENLGRCFHILRTKMVEIALHARLARMWKRFARRGVLSPVESVRHLVADDASGVRELAVIRGHVAENDPH
jgi:hypothetical protein